MISASLERILNGKHLSAFLEAFEKQEYAVSAGWGSSALGIYPSGNPWRMIRRCI